MKVHELIELLKKQPQDALVIECNPEARDEGLGHWYIPRYLHLTGIKADKVDSTDCIMFSYSEENYGWQDDSLDAISDGRFFRANDLNKDDFVWRGEEVPEKDGNYLCICKHGKRYYMAPNKPSTITQDERALAKAYLEHLHRGWMQNGDKLPWSIVR